jgi:DNA-binding MarR family transcriptional regulator
MTKKRQIKVNYEAMAEFRYAIRKYLSFSEQAASAAGLEPRQYQALLALKGHPKDRKPTIGALAEHLQIRHHTAVELASRLEGNGLVRRTRSRQDRREVLVRLARKGERVLERLALTHRAELQTAGPGLIKALEKIAGSAARKARARA